MTNADLVFTTEEFGLRLARTRQLMQERRIDFLIVDEIEAMIYLSGYGVSETLWRACGIPHDGEPFMMLRSLDVAPARERSWFSHIIGFRDWDDPLQDFVEAMSSRTSGARRIGVDFNSQSMPVARFEQLRSLLPGKELVDFGSAIWELRLKKSATEISYLRKAASIADAAMQKAVAAVRVGGNERDVARAAASAYLELGADDGLVGPLTSGKDWDSLHGHLHSHALQVGDIVHIELVPKVHQYSSRLMRSAVLGRAGEEQRKVARLLVELQDRQLAAIRPGAIAREIDLIIRKGVLEYKLRPSYDNITGYTLGAYPYPTQKTSDFSRIFTPGAAWVIEEGMTLHMYTSARGLAFSETMLVTAEGAERLTSTERKLFEVE